MAMAAVRFAARRLTGQQQQAILRTAVANEQGVLSRGGALRRFTSSEASAASGPKISTQHPSVSGDALLRTAEQKKEELCHLLTAIQRNKGIPLTRKIKDRLLLQRLASHVDVRPSNTEWHWYHQEYAVCNFMRGTAVFLSFLYMLEKWSEFFHGNKQVQGADSNSQASVSCAEQNIKN